jgi:hypothetical protein
LRRSYLDLWFLSLEFTIKYENNKSITGANTCLAVIGCWNLVTKVRVGSIGFADWDPINDNSYTNNQIHLQFHVSRFNDIISILRYEKPLTLKIDTTSSNGWIATSDSAYEPVGEQEPK